MSETVPEGWGVNLVGEMLTESRLTTSSENPAKRLSVRLHLKGVENRPERATDQVGSTKYFTRSAGQFIYGKQNLHKGALGIVPPKYDGYFSTQDIPAFDFLDGVDRGWLHQYFKQQEFYESLESIASGTGSKRVQPSDLFLVKIPTPPLPEQKKIASILTSVDEVIENTQRQIDKLQELKKATMNELLTKGIGHTEFKDSELGRIPKSWEVRKICGLVDPTRPVTYGIVQAGEHVADGVPYIRVSDMKANNLSLKNILRTDPEIAKKFKRSQVQTGDLVYALRGDVGKVLFVPSDLDGANLTQGTALISKSKKVTTPFLFWSFASEAVQKQTSDMAKGSTFVEMTLGNLKNILVALPPVDEQRAISSVLDSLSNAIDAKYVRLTQTQSLKKSLMQDLLTGKVRVQV